MAWFFSFSRMYCAVVERLAEVGNPPFRQVHSTHMHTMAMRRAGPYEMRWCHVLEIEGGRIVRFTDHLDTAPMLAPWRS